MHITLYRKYRPKDFEEIAGQKEIVKTLKASLRNGKTSHAYLFTGPRGVGKTTIARLIAKGVNCLEGITDEPCNKCENCLSINDGSFMDMIEIDAASNRGIDEIRQLKEKINYQPSKGRKKIYIIDEVHMLTKEAFNALLKTLEEPPEHVIFILATTEADKILPTIISRCQRYDFKALSPSEMKEKLEEISKNEGISVPDDVLDLIYENSGGSMRDATSILERLIITCLEEEITLEKCEKVLGVTPVKKMKEFLDFTIEKKYKELVRLLDEFWSESLEIEVFFKDFAKYCKNLMSKGELELEKGLKIIGAVYDSLNKFKYEEDKRMVGYVVINNLLSKKIAVVQEKVVERVIEKPMTGYQNKSNTEEEDNLNRQMPNTIPYYHFILTALDTEGHHQLRLLSTRAWLRAWKQGKMFRRPTYYSDLEEIIKPNQGHVIASTACLGSRIDKLLLQEYNDGHGIDKAFDEVMSLQNIFGHGDFYLEVQPAKDANSDQSHVNTLMWELHKKTGTFISKNGSARYSVTIKISASKYQFLWIFL